MPPAHSPILINQLMGRNRKEIGFQILIIPIIRQAHHQSNKRILNQIFTSRFVPNSRFDKCQQSALIFLYKATPGISIAFTNLADHEPVGLRSHFVNLQSVIHRISTAAYSVSFRNQFARFLFQEIGFPVALITSQIFQKTPWPT